MNEFDADCIDPRAVWLARAARTWRARVAERAARLDPGAVRAHFGLPCAAWRRAGRDARRTWLAAAGAVAPPAGAFDAPVARLALLSRAQLRRVLLARALVARTDALRRCIDAARLDRFDTQAGAGFVRRLLAACADTGAATFAEALLADDAPLSEWLHDGWRRVRAEPGLDRCAAALIAPALPFGDAAHDAVMPDDALGAMFFSRLPELFPELTWLFGCETMKPAWASTAT
ncbi:SctK family type III secretion system sorting platform protein [Burkholderia sp. BCC1977]|uniref:SctK family type III secretion system sorting platform protein n=1 Tax=Burkholderia sp. BCC1977 TaxID=2817440 RepID=UPI002ABD84BA|nr:SctK family type III secretion system sorting platform protein [Burkholderia sp. BCC1977]